MPPASRAPTRILERELLASGHQLVAGMDEVGRGALAGPVSVGVVVVDAGTGRLPRGLRDSKLLTPTAREALCEPVRRWATGSAVGHAGPEEIDEIGIIAALRLAGTRALATLADDGLVPDIVVLDGIHDWLTPPEDLFAGLGTPVPPVRTEVKGDLRCAAIAGASVLAKCERDARMVQLHDHHPAFGWRANKGYSAPEHLAALRELGPTVLHRRSWRLPGTDGAVQPGAEAPWPLGAGMPEPVGDVLSDVGDGQWASGAARLPGADVPEPTSPVPAAQAAVPAVPGA